MMLLIGIYNTESLTISILLTRAPHAFDINEIEPSGVHAIRNLTVECFLKLEFAWVLALYAFGRSMKVLVQV